MAGVNFRRTLSLAYFVKADLSLAIAFERECVRIAELFVLGAPALHALPPHVEGGALQPLTHKINHFRFGETELCGDGFEGCTVFPGHFDDAVFVGKGKLFVLHGDVWDELCK